MSRINNINIYDLDRSNKLKSLNLIAILKKIINNSSEEKEEKLIKYFENLEKDIINDSFSLPELENLFREFGKLLKNYPLTSFDKTFII